MADPDTDKTRQAADKTPNAEAPRQDADGLQAKGMSAARAIGTP